jgi:hypothetical protein
MSSKRTFITQLGAMVVFATSVWFYVCSSPRATAEHSLLCRLKRASFIDASVVSVLLDVVRQHPEETGWVAQVYERQLANTIVSVEFAEGCTLRDALRKVSQAAQCRYTLQEISGPDARTLLVIALKRSGAEERVGMVGNSSFPSAELVAVEPSHICEGIHKCPPKW